MANQDTGIDAIAALGDPMRRQIVHLLSVEASSVAELAKKLPVTRPAVSQHLRVLKEAGLVSHRSTGTRHIYYIDPEGIARLRSFLDRLWETALNEFKLSAEHETDKEGNK